VPLRLTLSAGAELVTLSVADRRPVVAGGVNVTLIVQLAPAAKLPPQLLVWAKLVAFVPVIPMLLISSEPLPPGLVSVTGCEALVVPRFWLKVSAGDRVADPEGATPVPVSVAVSGLARPATATDSIAEREPMDVGLNVTLMVQFAPPAKVVPQVPPAAPAGRTKTPAVVGAIGAIVILMPVSGSAPGFVNVSVCGALVVVIVWFPKEVGVDRVGSRTVPVMATFSVPAEPMSCKFVVRVPNAVDVNVTLIVQLAPAAKLAPQVLVCAKSVVFPVLNPMLVISSEPLAPVLVSVAGCETLVVPKLWPGKVSAVGDRVAAVEGAMPVPVSVAVTGAARPAPLTDSVAVLEVSAVGLNVTLIVQFVPAAKVAPQVPPAAPPGRANGPGVIVTLMAVSCTVPVLFNVTVSGALVVRIVWGGNAVAPVRLTVGATMLPVRATDCTEPFPMFKFSVAVLGFGVASPFGRKVTLIVQVPPGTTDPQPVLVWANCEGFAPANVIPTGTLTLPVLVTTTDCGALRTVIDEIKVRAAGCTAKVCVSVHSTAPTSTAFRLEGSGLA
jgi:hypothetical protein